MRILLLMKHWNNWILPYLPIGWMYLWVRNLWSMIHTSVGSTKYNYMSHIRSVAAPVDARCPGITWVDILWNISICQKPPVPPGWLVLVLETRVHSQTRMISSADLQGPLTGYKSKLHWPGIYYLESSSHNLDISFYDTTYIWTNLR
jgi:hypothetical protein